MTESSGSFISRIRALNLVSLTDVPGHETANRRSHGPTQFPG